MFKYVLFLFAFIPFSGISQNSNSCQNIHDGAFYFYPKNTGKKYFSIRSGNTLKEVEVNTTDTSYWSLTWTDACTYAMKYEKGINAKTNQQKELLASHKVVSKINTVTDAYYTFSAYMDKVSGDPVVSDTIWFKERDKLYNQVQFIPVANEALIKKARFSDTSQYAILYAYRSKKFSQSLVDYVVSMNDNAMFLSSNKSAYIFKILREGPSTFSTTVLKNKASTSLDVKFGKKYYLKCDVHFGMPSAKAELRIVDESIGKEEFLDTL